MYLLKFIVKRLLASVGIILGLTAVLFFLAAISHTDPVHAMLGAGATPGSIAAERHKLGLDKPEIVQYFDYLKNLLHGNMGMSYRTRRPVASDIATYLPATVELAGFSLVLSVLLGLALGIASGGSFRGSGALRFVLISGASVPQFLLAIGGLLFLYGKLNLLPATGIIGIANAPTGPTGIYLIDGILHGDFGVTVDAIKYLIMPSVSISLGPAVSIGRVLRGSLISSLGSDYVKTARSKGLGGFSILIRHALRNSLGPALSMTGLQAGLMFSGVVVIEDIFAWPGIGYYTAQSIPSGDFPAIAGVTLVLGVGYVIINALVDLAQLLADPRLKRLEMGPSTRGRKKVVSQQNSSLNSQVNAIGDPTV